MKKNRLLSLILTSVMVSVLTACGTNTAGPAPAQETDNTAGQMDAASGNKPEDICRKA